MLLTNKPEETNSDQHFWWVNLLNNGPYPEYPRAALALPFPRKSSFCFCFIEEPSGRPTGSRGEIPGDLISHVHHLVGSNGWHESASVHNGEDMLRAFHSFMESFLTGADCAQRLQIRARNHCNPRCSHHLALLLYLAISSRFWVSHNLFQIIFEIRH